MEKTSTRRDEQSRLVVYRQVGFYLRYDYLITPDEVEEILENQRNFVILSTKLNPMAIPEYLDLDVEKLRSEGFRIKQNRIGLQFWKGGSIKMTQKVEREKRLAAGWGAIIIPLRKRVKKLPRVRFIDWGKKQKESLF